jgi:hypothetical protein
MLSFDKKYSLSSLRSLRENSNWILAGFFENIIATIAHLIKNPLS